MTAYKPTFKPVPYSAEEKESMKRADQELQDYDDAQLAKEQREQVAAWTASNGKPISLHFNALHKEIYWKVDGEFAGAAKVSGLRRANDQEAMQGLHAVVDGSPSRLGLTKEHYLALRAKLV